MLRIPIPTFYFDASDEERWRVIDGLQRLTAFSNYLVGEEKEGSCVRTKKKLEGLQYLKEFEGKTFYGFRNYHLYLSMYYGDYMALPPKEEQVPKLAITELELTEPEFS